MSGWFRSLQVRLSLLLVGLLLGVSGLYVWLLLRSANSYMAEEVQRSNQTLAASVAQVLRIDERTNEIPQAALKRTFDAAMVINPHIKLYLVGLDGRILTSSAKPNEVKLEQVPIPPIRAFLQGSSQPPIWGADPRQPDKPSIFSVVMLHTAGGKPYCYLYITLDGPPAAGPDAQRNSYILKVLLRTLALAGLCLALACSSSLS